MTHARFETPRRRRGSLLCALLVSLTGCAPVATPGEPPATYLFDSRFEPGTSSVSYSGQVMRQVLLADLVSHIGSLTDRIDSGDLMPAAGEVRSSLEFYWLFDSGSAGALGFDLSTDPATLQASWDDISTDKDLRGKFAGNDPVGQHRDWTVDFRGQQGVTSAEALVLSWFDELDALAVDRSLGTVPNDPDGAPVEEVWITADGRDLKQLIGKLVGMGVAFSQGVDDYLDDDTEGKGLLSDNTVAEEGKPYTALEHAWDEGFGYFGAARDYADYSDDEIAAAGGRDDRQGHHDSDGDGAIDLNSEYNFLHSVNAAKRDLGSVQTTDYTGDAFTAFVHGRFIISNADGALSEEDMVRLREQRDAAVRAWESAVAATCVHYVNEVLRDMEAVDANAYDFTDHAKHWSELKGFALGLQFNPRSPLSDADFDTLHELIGDAPVLPGDPAFDGAMDDLRAARALIGSAWGFAPENLGSDDGSGGW